MKHANYTIERDDAAKLVIRDVGPWHNHPTVTNDAEWVVKQLARRLAGRQLYYYDSDNYYSEIYVNERGQFEGFGPIHNVPRFLLKK